VNDSIQQKQDPFEHFCKNWTDSNGEEATQKIVVCDSLLKQQYATYILYCFISLKLKRLIKENKYDRVK
jgi:hypothetical protein